MIRTQISMTKEQQVALRRLAASRGVSQSAILRQALDEVVAQDRRRSHLERALKVAGRFASRADDGLSGSVDHDRILNEGPEPSW